MTETTALSLPEIGLGTYKMQGQAGADSVAAGIRAGYRLIDSAYNYENEGAVGAGIRAATGAGGIRRDEVIVTSKLPGRYQQHDDAVFSVEESLFRLGLDRIDLHLIHWPNPKQGHYVEAFETLLELRERGLIRHVGVCNFLPEHLEAVHSATGEYPVVNQIELHPHFPQAEAVAVHRELGIVTQAWSPLLRGAVLEEPVIAEIADAHSATPGQVVLAWHRGRGVLAIPKAASQERQRENLDSLNVTLSAAEIEAITALGRPDGRRKNQDPAVYEEF
ncbi:aldo/keto reductase [Corynebacterium jeikeium]|uniref:aldo/keto reductase n=1 Tax=Corynebacterium jeikeium TaxID=38289 RepID=UPI000881CDDD|nr:aldo/keto reductase [Corynebacterium jeikeium]SCX18417.1 2,5-diketo-D-gluconic acid reductase B [Corynebacterium jeikeium]